MRAYRVRSVEVFTSVLLLLMSTTSRAADLVIPTSVGIRDAVTIWDAGELVTTDSFFVNGPRQS
jgi:hypothetical protein